MLISWDSCEKKMRKAVEKWKIHKDIQLNEKKHGAKLDKLSYWYYVYVYESRLAETICMILYQKQFN